MQTKRKWFFILGVLTLFGVPMQLYAAGTPAWWNNPFGYTLWRQAETQGVFENNGHQAQFLRAIIDVPNQYNQSLSKDVWIRVQWRMARGTEGGLVSDPNAHVIRWLDGQDPQRPCPASPLEPYPTPDGQRFLINRGTFAPDAPYTFGYELSTEGIQPQPACERIDIQFFVGADCRLEYHIEVQTVCRNLTMLDYGDAPDPIYNVLSTNMGARHEVMSRIYMGQSVDGEAEAHQSAQADGDDLNPGGGTDDEDAITNLDPSGRIVLNVGVIPSFTMNVSTPNDVPVFVNGWIDFNGNGQWEASEAATNGIQTRSSSGPITLTFRAPTMTDARNTFARFRLSVERSAVMTPTFGPNDHITIGEVEDYPVIVEGQDIDFGDAPDGPYPTLLANNGARHTIVPNFYMGSTVDAEADGQPNMNASGDDLNGDDEDAFNMPIMLTVGVPVTLTIPVTAPGGQPFTLNGWIDFNNNGSWLDAGEFASASGTGTGVSQNVVLNFNAPTTVVTQTFARFRLASSPNYIALPTGAAPDGEVEDHPVLIQEPELDFGDAPNSLNYPTPLSRDGARHIIVPGLYMGYGVDPESDAHLIALNAAGDDRDDGNDDEDGIDPATLFFTQNQSRTLQVLVHTPSLMTVHLYGWIDYNADRVWDNSERAYATWTGSGSHLLPLTMPVVPPNSYLLTNGHTYARFRLSTNRAAASIPTGLADDGEVEDYIVDILVPVELSAFSGAFVDNAVKLEWTTQSETENLGFHIYRSETENGQYTRINSDLIPGAGTSQTAHSYQYIDQTAQVGKTYYYKLADVNYNGHMNMNGPIKVQSAPSSYGLEQNYPNPFNPKTVITFKQKEAGEVDLAIYNLRGQLVRRLISQQMPAGEHQAVWDGKNDAGQIMPTGTYIYKLKINGYEESKKMEFVK